MKENIKFSISLITYILSSIITGFMISIVYTSTYWYNNDIDNNVRSILNTYSEYVNYRIMIDEHNSIYLACYYVCWIVYAILRCTYYKLIGAYK